MTPAPRRHRRQRLVGRGGDDRVVARLEQGYEQRRQAVVTAAGGRYVVRRDPLIAGRDRLPQRRPAERRRTTLRRRNGNYKRTMSAIAPPCPVSMIPN